MKKLFLFITALLFVACSKSDDNTSPPVNEIDKLPLATQIGANTVGCLVDGKAFLPYGDSPGSGGNPRCDYINNNLLLGFSNLPSKYPQYTIIISLRNTILQNTKYILDNSKEGKYIVYKKGYEPLYFKTDSIYHIGELYISKFDRVAGIISGTFWFDAVNKKGRKLKYEKAGLICLIMEINY